MGMAKSKSICVFCASSNRVDSVYVDAARELGRHIGQRGHALIYGGVQAGLMRAVGEAAHKHGAKTTAILPAMMHERGISFDRADQTIVTETMAERKAEMHDRADAFIALPGGFGTLEELFEIITLKQLKYHDKAVVIINTNGFYDPMLDMFEHMFKTGFAKDVYRGLYQIVSTSETALEYVENYAPNEIESKYD